MSLHSDWKKWGTKAGLSILDQGLVSGANFAFNILLARWLSPAEYGAFAVAFSVFLFLAGIHNALIVEPMSVLGPSRYTDCLASYVGTTVRMQWGVTLFLCVVLGLATVVSAMNDSLLTSSLAGLTIAQPFILFFWFSRQVCYLESRTGTAATYSGIYALLLLAGLIAFKVCEQLSNVSAFLNMGMAGALAGCATLYIMLIRPRPSSSIRCAHKAVPVLAQHWEYGRWQTAASVLSVFTNHIQMFVLAGFSGLDAAGALRAMQIVMLPMAHIMAAFSRLALPVLSLDFGRKNVIGLKKKGLIVTGILTGAASTYALLLLLFYKPIEVLLYGGKFQAYAWLIPLLGMIPVFSGFGSGFSLVLRAFQKPQHYLYSYLLAAPSGLVSALVFTRLWGIEGGVVSQVLTCAVSAGSTFYLYRAWVPRTEKGRLNH